jgi:ubiquinone/menaquinone biosynthesis C-methylase UbiE
MREPWWETLYEMQHEVWSAWAESSGGAAEKADFLTQWLGLGAGERLLDLGCGSGREVVALASRGHACVGLDISEPLLERARRRAEAAGVSSLVHFIRGDFRSLPRDGLWPGFAAALFLDSPLGIYSPEAVEQILRDVRGLLAPGGRVVIDHLNPAFWDRDHPEQRIEAPGVGPGHTIRRYTFDRATRVLTDENTFYPPQGAPIDLPKQHLRLFDAEEWAELLADAGYEDIEVGGTRGWIYEIPPIAPADAACASIVARGTRHA